MNISVETPNPVTIAVIGCGQRGDVCTLCGGAHIHHTAPVDLNSEIPHLGLCGVFCPRAVQMQGSGNCGTTTPDTGALRRSIWGRGQSRVPNLGAVPQSFG